LSLKAHKPIIAVDPPRYSFKPNHVIVASNMAF